MIATQVTAGGVLGFLLSAIVVVSLWTFVLGWIGGKVGSGMGKTSEELERNQFRGTQVGRLAGLAVAVVTGVIYAFHGGLK